MTVSLLHSTPLWVCSTAIRKCWASEGKSDTYLIEGEAYHTGSVTHGGEDVDCIGIGEKDKELIERIGNKNKHASTLEHLSYSFDIDGISRACLQELARHRHASLSVKSTRYTLKELKTADYDDLDRFLVQTDNGLVNEANYKALLEVQSRVQGGLSNDLAKFMLPEAYKTSLVWTINARALQNFLQLRTNKAALWEIRDLAYEVYDNIPDEHQYLFKEFLYERD